MTEDIVYSTVLFCKARKYISIDFDGYFYVRNSKAATTLVPDKEKFIKHINDLNTCFSFCYQYLKDNNLIEPFGADFEEWKSYFYRLWCRNIKESTFSEPDKLALYKKLQNAFDQERIIYPYSSDGYYYSEVTKWIGEHYHNLIRTIISKEIEYVSFDIFDTLIKRPFFVPTDLFLIMDYELVKKFPEKVKLNFSELRIRAENETRRRISSTLPSFQEITLDEIYEYMQKELSFDQEVIEYAKKREVELELEFCSSRKSVQELYDLAQSYGKKVIIVSDMYLPRSVIEKILHKNGYSNYFKLYLSSEIRLTKHQGDLFKYVLRDLNADSSSIVHIGDNWDSDYVNSNKYGIKGIFYPKATSVLMGEIQGAKSRRQAELLNKARHGYSDHRHFIDYLGHRTMLGIIANRYFDNPFRQFNLNSDFNLDPYFVGYFALGMNMLGIGMWMHKEVRKHNYKKLHFVARDGYLVKKVFDKLNFYSPIDLSTDYIHLSRRAIIPMTLHTEQDLFALYHLINSSKFSPQDILIMFLRVDSITDELKARFEERGVLLNKNFSSGEEFNNFAKAVIDLKLMGERLVEYRKLLRRYFDRVFSENDAIFDIGYNGTTQIILSNFLDRQIDGFYVHLNKDKALRPNTVMPSNVYSFLDYTPTIKGTIREYLFSEVSPSCIQYKEDANGNVTPDFEEDPYNSYDRYILNHIHRGVLDFVEEFLDNFHEYLDLMTFRNYEISLPLEDFLHQPTHEDQKLFAYSSFNDIISGIYAEQMTLLDIWNQELNNAGLLALNPETLTRHYSLLDDHLANKKMIQKAIYFLLFDFFLTFVLLF